MKRRYEILFLLIISPLLLTQCHFVYSGQNNNTTRELRPLTNTEKMIATSSQSFGVDVFKDIVAKEKKGTNVFISPLSLSMALGMAVNGAAGKTRTDMLKAMEINDTNFQDLNTSYQGLTNLLLNADPKVQMQIANAVWYRKGLTVKQSFADTSKKYYDAAVKGLNFGDGKSADIINNWVSNQTHGHITKMVQSPISSNIIMSLMNAIYFKGSWIHKFDSTATKPGNFTLSDGSTVKPDMMHMTATMPYYDFGSGQMLDMAYGDSLFSMTILLPSAGTNIDTFIAGLNANELNSWIAKLHNVKVQISMPKFTLKYKIELNNILADMGMGIAFTSGADFSNMTPGGNLKISSVMQKSFIKVDESGTEAAAATSIGFTNVVINNQTFNADRPFVYLIRERSSGTILFIGKLENPTL